MSASKRTMDLGESALKRREFLAVGGATITATAVGGAYGVDRMDRTLPDERAQEALSEVEAMTFDVFGTVVDWRTSIIRKGQLRSSPELCVKVRGSSSMLRLGCLGDLLGFEKREIEVAAFAPDRSSPQSNRGDKAERTGSVGEGAGAPDPTLDLGVQALEAVRGA